MGEIVRIDSHWEQTVEPSILEQYRGSEKWKGVLKSVIDKIQEVENDASELSTILRFDDGDHPSGYKLDWMGSLVNVARIAGESDDEYFIRIKTTIGADSAGTPDYVINLAGELSRSNYKVDPKTGTKIYDSVEYMEEVAATFFIYTPTGRQLLLRQVKSMSPAGVLGLPGAAIQFEDGSLMGDYDKKVFLAVANEDGVED